MILETLTVPCWLSNGYLVAAEAGGPAALIDAGAPAGEVLAALERHRLSLTHLLVTHRHPDHVASVAELRERLGCRVLAHRLEAPALPACDECLEGGERLACGALSIEVLHVPGHTAGHLAFLVDGSVLFTGDTLFRGSVGGTRGSGSTGLADLRRSVLETLLGLSPEVEVYPGHTDSTTIAREREANPFVRAWRGLDPPGDAPCLVRGEPARLLLRARDYDGGTKCWVRFERDGREDVVGGSAVHG